MKRRQFVRTTGLAGASAIGLAACGSTDCGPQTTAGAEQFRWKMVTSWPLNFPGLGGAANQVAAAITAMSGGRLTVKVYGAGDLVPAFEVFDAVSSGTAEMGHSGAYYWKGKSESLQFFSAIPFGLNAMQMNGWLYFGDGLKLWEKAYAPFNLVPFPAGNSGVQMGGWFNREINTVDDLKGLKMRIPGMGGEVLKRAGGTPVTLPGSELFTALQSGTIDATEWVGPWNDRAFGLYQAARYYYYPGWHEPGTTLECMVNKTAFDSLPDDLQAIVRHACRSANDTTLAEFTTRNSEALAAIEAEPGVDLRRFPQPVLARLQALSDEVVQDLADRDAAAREIFQSFSAFRDRARAWGRISETAYAEALAGG